MKQYTHISISLGVGMLFLSLFNLLIRLQLVFLLAILIFVTVAKIPDTLDFYFKDHKRHFWTHSPLSPLWILTSFLVGLLFSTIHVLLGIYMIFTTYLVLLTHFILDGLNPAGVPLLPLEPRIHLGTIRYDSLSLNLALTLLGFFLLNMAFIIFFLNI